MHWVIEKNLFREYNFKILLEQLEKQEVEYTLVSVVPFSHDMEPDVNLEGNVFVCGSTAIGTQAKKKGWVPGYFDDNLNMEIVTKQYGDNMLNSKTVFTTLKDAIPPFDRVFVRPCSDKKEFAGQVMDHSEFIEWRDKVVELEGTSTWTSLKGEDQIMMAPVTFINAEFRFFVVDGVVVTGSLYKRGFQVYYSSDVDEEVYAYAQSMVDKWQPNRAFCLDVALTDVGYKVIEINSINSAGFYALDMGKYISAINSMEF